MFYIFGAGVNKAIKLRYGVRKSGKYQDVSPPLTNDLFKVAQCMAHGRFEHQLRSSYFEKLASFIEKYWKKNIRNLMRSKFDIEECLTYIESQTREAEANHDDEKLQQLVDIEYLLIRLICEVLSEFNSLIPPFLQYEPPPPNLERFGTCVSFKKLGEILYHQKPIMISFNWDDFIERSIEHASGISACYKDAQASPIHMGYGSWNWNRALGYGIQFDQLPDPSNHHKLYPNYLDGNRFYSRNSLYSWHLLKLHGSLNWFRYIPYTPDSILRDKKEDLKKLFEERRNKILLHDATWVPEFFSQGHPSLHNLYIDPLIITPILHRTSSLRINYTAGSSSPCGKKPRMPCPVVKS